MAKSNSLTPLFNTKDIDKMIARFGVNAEAKVYQTLVQAGEYAVSEARKGGVYNNITGNLRSSIGYVITKDGSVIAENFEKSQHGSDRNTGVATARQLAVRTAISVAKKGYVLVVVAGMEYAAAVQDIAGKDVLEGAIILTENYLSTLISHLRKKL